MEAQRAVVVVEGHVELVRPMDAATIDDSTWRRAVWLKMHWKGTSPLVFINGCHTAEITPESLLSFVDTFIKAYASGVIGTEITVDQNIANRVGEEFFYHFQQRNKTVGENLHAVRMNLLADYNNLLGIAYTPYCSVDLHIDLN